MGGVSVKWRSELVHREAARQVERLKIEKLTLNQLFRYLARVEPGFQMLIAI